MKKLFFGDILGLLNGIYVIPAMAVTMILFSQLVSAQGGRDGILKLVSSHQAGEIELSPALGVLEAVEAIDSIIGVSQLRLLDDKLTLDQIRQLEALFEIKFEDIIEANPLVAAKTFLELKKNNPLIWTQHKWEELNLLVVQKLTPLFQVTIYGEGLAAQNELIEIDDVLSVIIGLGGDVREYESRIESVRKLFIVDKASISLGLIESNQPTEVKVQYAKSNIQFLIESVNLIEASPAEKKRLFELSLTLVKNDPLIEETMDLIFADAKARGYANVYSQKDWLGSLLVPIVSLGNEFAEIKTKIIKKLISADYESKFLRTLLEDVLSSMVIEDAPVELMGDFVKVISESLFHSVKTSSEYEFETVEHRMNALKVLLSAEAFAKLRFDWIMESIRQSGMINQSPAKFYALAEQIQQMLASTEVNKEYVLELAELVGVEPLSPILVQRIFGEFNAYLLENLREDIVVQQKMLNIFKRSKFTFVKTYLKSWVTASYFEGQDDFRLMYGETIIESLNDFFYEGFFMDALVINKMLRELSGYIKGAELQKLAADYLAVQDNLLVVDEIRYQLEKLASGTVLPIEVKKVGCFEVLTFRRDDVDPKDESDTTE